MPDHLRDAGGLSEPAPPGGADAAKPRALTAAARRHYWEILAMSVACIALAFALEVRGDQRVCLRGHPGAALPGTCLSREWFHVDCPGCGLTRSFVLLAHGDFAGSWRMHRVGWLMALLVAAQIPYRLIGLKRNAPILGKAAPRWIGYGMIAILLGNWLVGKL
jgi:hypothetical protein